MYPVLKIMHMLNFLDTFSVGVTSTLMKDFREKSSIGHPTPFDCLTLLQSLNHVPEYVLRYISLFLTHEEMKEDSVIQ